MANMETKTVTDLYLLSFWSALQFAHRSGRNFESSLLKEIWM